jgi:hypothetical protein
MSKTSRKSDINSILKNIKYILNVIYIYYYILFEDYFLKNFMYYFLIIIYKSC